MKRWLYLIPGMIVVLLAGAYVGFREHNTAHLPGNIILVSIDTLRADHVGSYGYHRNTTPNLDRLAKQGVRFQNVASTTSWTIPAHMGMFTSQYDLVHGVLIPHDRLDDKRITMAETMKKAGYTTAGFFSSITLDPVFGFGKGFDDYICCYSYSAYVDPFRKKGSEENFHQLRSRIESSVPDKDLNLQKLSWQDVTNPIVHRKVTGWLEEHHQERFFLFVHYWDPHYDYIPPSPYDTMFDPGYQGDINGKGFITNPDIKPGMDPRDLEHVVALYDGEIR
ncbi:MAG: sulfatase-like hydrolase/transferase, partial [bacterium]